MWRNLNKEASWLHTELFFFKYSLKSSLHTYIIFFWKNTNIYSIHILLLIIILFLLFLGGLSLHLNHLIESCAVASYQLFGTLPIGILFSNLGSGQLMTCPRTLFGQIWHMSLFGDSRALRVLMPKYRPFRKSFFSRWRSGDFLEA